MVRVGDCTSDLAMAHRAGDIGPAAKLHAHEHLGGVISLLGQIHHCRVEGDQADLTAGRPLKMPAITALWITESIIDPLQSTAMMMCQGR